MSLQEESKLKKRKIIVLSAIVIAAVLVAMLLLRRPNDMSKGDGGDPIQTVEQTSDGSGQELTGRDEADESIPSVTVGEDFEVELGETESMDGF